ncbi:hypothetical protein DZ858_05760 [Marixanthomonas ophiurae]|uniref:Uncharacterized protein n=1 Tax=Marixanthomonas ophiurae TaxID=387659 RepID=A0A3E1QBS5_9FLAO|nr:hypothetical protein DZ858_05760 [Marixanthomonas ophiurae]
MKEAISSYSFCCGEFTNNIRSANHQNYVTYRNNVLFYDFFKKFTLKQDFLVFLFAEEKVCIKFATALRYWPMV